MSARQTSLIDATWIPVKDGNPTGMDLFLRHYTARPNHKVFQFVGPGEKLLLLTPDARALFVWRKFFSDSGEQGVNCAVFRNEGTIAGVSSDLIRAADDIALERWPRERLYTYIDPEKVRHKRDPGRCFLRAGWRHCGWSKGGLRILEIVPVAADLEHDI